MSKYAKIREKIMSGKSDNNISEEEMHYFFNKIGAKHKRTNGSHDQYAIDGIPEQFNIQPKQGKIKGYEVRQVRNIVNKYDIKEGGE